MSKIKLPGYRYYTDGTKSKEKIANYDRKMRRKQAIRDEKINLYGTTKVRLTPEELSIVIKSVNKSMSI